MRIFRIIGKVIGFLAKVLVLIAAVNWIFTVVESFKHRKIPEGGKYFEWKHGKVFYHKRGTGSPIILLHSFEPTRSGKDLDTLSKHLSTNHTVYRIDLPGFGLSEKPWITYTNFLYVSLILDFIQNVVGDISDVVACGGSGLCALQAYKMDPSKIGKIILIDPCYQEPVRTAPKLAAKLRGIIDLPVIGTFIYNMYSLTFSEPLDKEGRHVFTSRLAGSLKSSLTGHENLITPNVAVLKNKNNEESFTFGDVKASLN